MTVQERVWEIIASVKRLEENETAKVQNALPSNCYFLNEEEILCYERSFGDSRYPYSKDGLTLWAHASGNIKIEESTFNVIVETPEGKEPNIAFFLGEKQGEEFFPVSLTGLAKQPVEEGVKRYAVFAPEAAYYFTETKEVTACVRMFIDEKKNSRFTLYCKNTSDKPVESYLSAYFNCLISYTYEYHETKWYRTASVVENGFLVQVNECLNRLNMFTHYGRIARDIPNDKVYSTTAHTDFNGGQHTQLCASSALRKGKFAFGKQITCFSDTAIEGDIIPLSLSAGEEFCVSYTLAFGDDKGLAERNATEFATTAKIDELLYGNKDGFGKNIPEISFEGMELPALRDRVTSYFLKNVCRQNEFCARAKNYAGPLIGIRDIFQQLESALMWIPEYCREKIVEALNYIGENGRAPRQYSYANKGAIPAMDLRPYIDQGVWIISTVYTYLCYTSDYSILDEICGYFKFDGGMVAFSEKKDSVLDHLLCICEYLLSNLDEETNCLHALYGDWNDALDGLGRTEDEGKEYGTGVSVMATLQLCKNLSELDEILTRLGREKEAVCYRAHRESIKTGLLRYAVVENGAGEKKVLHGWGDKREWFVGSYADNDGYDRDSLTSHAFWVLSGAIDWDGEMKESILATYKRLDSKYGLKTFEPYFATDNKRVGRIVNLPKGTAENGAVYIHATLFGIWSLFKMGEAKLAWEQLVKILPLTHSHISTTPFVMSNSYCYNEEFGIDGESMSDWFTGSGCVLLKVIMWQVFGIQADLEKLYVRIPNYVPFKKGSISLCVKGGNITVEYEKKGDGRTLFVNGERVEEIALSNAEIAGKTVHILIEDKKSGCTAESR